MERADHTPSEKAKAVWVFHCIARPSGSAFADGADCHLCSEQTSLSDPDRPGARRPGDCSQLWFLQFGVTEHLDEVPTARGAAKAREVPGSRESRSLPQGRHA